MYNFLVVILASVLSAVFGALLGFFITNVANRKQFEMTTKGAMKVHEDVYHQDKIWAVVEKVVAEHKIACDAPKIIVDMQGDVQNLRLAVAWLVKQAGGNPTEFGLVK
jgi:hypothetical protein